jgi:hypothetical protein
MHVFRELFIRGEPDRLTAALAEIERTLSDGWFRDKETERQLAEVGRAGSGTVSSGRCRRGTGALLIFLGVFAQGALKILGLHPSQFL